MNHNNTARNHFGNMAEVAVVLILIELLLLAVQFIIGMWMNLFAVFPSIGSTFFMYGMMHGMMRVMLAVPELMVHMMLGILIGIVSLLILMAFAMGRNYVLLLLSVIASLSVLIAGISGIEFMFSGFANNTLSFIMSMGFLFTIISYSIILYIIGRDNHSQFSH